MEKGKYIVRQAIKDSANRILGYEILYSDNQAYSGSDANNDYSAAEAIYECLMQNTEKALRNSRTFMTFTSSLLAKRTPHLFKSVNLVIQIDDSVIIHPFAMHLVQRYVKEGYEIAANDFQFMPRYLALLEYLSYIKINLSSISQSAAENIVRVASNMSKRVIATGVETQELYDFAQRLGVYGMQGSFVADRMANKVHDSSYLRSNFFRLVVAVTRDEPDIVEIEQIISMDVMLSYSLLKIANSAYFALRTKTSSIQQAIMTLGMNQLKRWVYLLSAGDSEGETLEDSEEFIKLSFMRASFASELQKYMPDPPLTNSEAYLLGLFSTLEHLIDAPLEDIIADIPMEDDFRAALLHHEGRAGLLLNLVMSYEKADWMRITACAEIIGISPNRLTQIYFDCMEEVNTLWEQMLHPNAEDSDTPMQAGAGLMPGKLEI